MHLSRYIKTYPCRENPSSLLLFSTRRLSKILVPCSVMKAIEAGTLSPRDEQTLSRLGFLVSDPDAERREMLDALAEINRHGDKGHVMAVMNLDCNLACRYCFEGNRKGEYYMSPETADLLVDFVAENYLQSGKNVNIDFYCGEPL
ncbi:MAG TPA: putative geopeptide radical SAM maturase, partial [Geobacteraceae bacterium]|nr:putative geopeptide radical SAM maturase [Geobacteraceae bacterium]